MVIHVAKAGQPSKQYPLDEINRLLAKGDLSAEDSAWHEGLPKWVPLKSIRGVQLGTRPEWQVPETQATANPNSPVWGTLREQAGIPTVWRPELVALWGVLFGPVFVALLGRRNWRALRHEDQARRGAWWLYSALLLHLILLVSVIGQFTVVVLIAGGLLGLEWLLWLVVEALAQRRCLQVEFERQYFPAPWAKPLLWGLLFWALYLGILLLGRSLIHQDQQGNPPPTHEAR